jgi:hypothetical protein
MLLLRLEGFLDNWQVHKGKLNQLGRLQPIPEHRSPITHKKHIINDGLVFMVAGL